MQDRHEVVLEANITKFKQKMKEAENVSKEVGKKIAENTKFNVWENGVMTLTNGVRLVKKDASELNQTFNETSKTSNIVGNDINKAFTKGLKSVKRLTLGFLGARSAFMLFRKYLGEYQSQNEDFANKMQLTTNILVNSLAPAFEFFGNVVQYTVIGLARIIELLTGVNILAKTVDKGFKGASKSAKEFNDNLSGLDEISNISESGNLSTGIGSQLNALVEFQNKIKEVDEWLEKTKIKKFFEDISPVLKDVFGWISEHPLGTLGIIGGLGTIKLILPSVLGVAGGTTGLFGIATVLAIIAGINIYNIVDGLIKLNESINGTENTVKGNIETLEEAQKKAKEFTSSLSDEQAQNNFSFFGKNIDKTITNITDKLDDLEKYKHFPFRTDPNQKADKALLEGYITSLMTYVELQDEAYRQGKLTTDQEVEYKNTLNKVKDALQNAKDEGYKYDDALSKINSKLVGLDKKTFNIKLKFTTDVSELQMFTNSLKDFKLPSYDVGTNYVPRDQIAMVHEGEAIIPKKYNNSEYLGQMGNSETNALLTELNRSILEFANRPQAFNVNGKELAKVTYGDFQEESSRRGTNTSIRRV